MRNIWKKMQEKDIGAIGIGAMIVFIGMVLVAGIAASVLIQTSNTLEAQALKTGGETIDEVSTGLAVYDIEGYANTDENISKIGIVVRPRAGSQDVDLNIVYLELCDETNKIILRYRDATASNWIDYDDAGVDDIFTQSAFPASPDDYGILILEDADSSASQANPVINRGDKAILCVDTSQCFSTNSGWPERTDIWGLVVPEVGSPGVIDFRTPASYNEIVMDLQ